MLSRQLGNGIVTAAEARDPPICVDISFPAASAIVPHGISASHERIAERQRYRIRVKRRWRVTSGGISQPARRIRHRGRGGNHRLRRCGHRLLGRLLTATR